MQNESKEVVDKHFGNTTLLVVAHPDDETMFFGPTIVNLVKNNKSLVILCLTNGDADGLGQQREQEFSKVIEAFGSKVTLNLIKDPKLPDSIVRDWDKIQVANYIQNQIVTHHTPIKTLITFDSYGVSGHINHRSIYQATIDLKDKSKDLITSLLVLKSISIWRKYTFFLDSISTTLSKYLYSKEDSTVRLGINLAEHYSLKQTLKLHHSQIAWFRQLYMIFSRYMFINEFEYIV